MFWCNPSSELKSKVFSKNAEMPQPNLQIEITICYMYVFIQRQTVTSCFCRRPISTFDSQSYITVNNQEMVKKSS